MLCPLSLTPPHPVLCGLTANPCPLFTVFRATVYSLGAPAATQTQALVESPWLRSALLPYFSENCARRLLSPRGLNKEDTAVTLCGACTELCIASGKTAKH